MTADLLIIGGGPAGAAAAIAARAAGLTVCIIEREEAPRVRPGETAHPGIEPLLAELGVIEAVRSAGFLRHSGTWIELGDQPRYFAPFGADQHGSWQGFQLWRPVFDAILLNAATQNGAELLRCGRDVRPLIEGGRVAGISAAERTIPARIVIDASGRQRWLARHLGLDITQSSPRMIAWFSYMTGECAACDEAPAIKSDVTGWTWTAQVRPDVYQWVRLSHDGARPPKGWRPEEFAALSDLDSSRGIDVTWSCVRPSADENWFLAGDAAFVLDPASSHGLLKALMSGMAAAHHAAAVLFGRASAADAARDYDAWMKSWFERDCAALRALYRQSGAAFHSESPSFTPAG